MRRDPIRLIRGKTELQGTCHVELPLAEYRERCWNDGSVFLAEAVFGLVEPIVDLNGEDGFINSTTEGVFASNFRANTDALARLAGELSDWVRLRPWQVAHCLDDVEDRDRHDVKRAEQIPWVGPVC